MLCNISLFIMFVPCEEGVLGFWLRLGVSNSAFRWEVNILEQRSGCLQLGLRAATRIQSHLGEDATV